MGAKDIEEEAQAIENGIKRLLDGGFTPTSEAVVKLRNDLKGLFTDAKSSIDLLPILPAPTSLTSEQTQKPVPPVTIETDKLKEFLPLAQKLTLVSEQFQSGWIEFGDAFKQASDLVVSDGNLMQQTFLAMGAAMQQAAASGASSFGALAQAAAGAAASVIRSWIQQGVAAAVSKALTTIPFPFNLAAGAAAGAAAAALFTKAIGSIGIKGFARGTNNAPGGLAMVGERGPELVNLPRHSQVFSTQQSRRMAASMNGGGSFFGEFILRGQDLALVVERTQRKNQRFR